MNQSFEEVVNHIQNAPIPTPESSQQQADLAELRHNATVLRDRLMGNMSGAERNELIATLLRTETQINTALTADASAVTGQTLRPAPPTAEQSRQEVVKRAEELEAKGDPHSVAIAKSLRESCAQCDFKDHQQQQAHVAQQAAIEQRERFATHNAERQAQADAEQLEKDKQAVLGRHGFGENSGDA